MSESSVRRDRQLGAAWMPEMPGVKRRLGKTDAELLKAGICPICGAGPYTSPAGHVAKAHGINRFDLREMVGLYRREPVCDPTHSAACAERARRRMERGELNLVPPRTGKRVLSSKALILQKEKAQKVDRQALGRVLADNYAERSAERDAEIIAAAQSGERFKSIAQRFGVGVNTVNGILHRRGVDVDGRPAYWASRKGKDFAPLAAKRQENVRRLATERAEIAAAIAAGESVKEVAERLKTTPERLRGRLRRHGIALPDGRSDPNRKKPPPRAKAEPWYCTIGGCDRVGIAKGRCSPHYQQLTRRRSGAPK